MGLPTNDLNSVFWLSGATMLFAFLGVLAKYSYKSKCIQFSICFGLFKVTRDVAIEKEEDIIELEHKQESPKTDMNV